MRLILDDCFVSDETEPGLLSGVGRPSCLHLTNPTSRFSQLWKTSGQVAERRNSFLCCEVSTDKVSSLFRPPGLLRRYQGLMWRGSQHLGPSDESQWSASEASASLREAVKNPPGQAQNLRGLLVMKCSSTGPIPRTALEYSMPWMHTKCSLTD